MMNADIYIVWSIHLKRHNINNGKVRRYWFQCYHLLICDMIPYSLPFRESDVKYGESKLTCTIHS